MQLLKIDYFPVILWLRRFEFETLRVHFHGAKFFDDKIVSLMKDNVSHGTQNSIYPGFLLSEKINNDSLK